MLPGQPRRQPMQKIEDNPIGHKFHVEEFFTKINFSLIHDTQKYSKIPRAGEHSKSG